MERTVQGDALAALLAGPGPLPDVVCVDPPPESWADVKPALLGVARRAWAAGRSPPGFRGVPACLLGLEHREVPLLPARWPAPERCGACRMRPECSPPRELSTELTPFGPAEPLEQWRLFHARGAALLGVPHRPLLDDLVAAATARVAGGGAPSCVVEPSIVLDGAGGLARSLRVGLFPGEPRGASVATRDATASLVEVLVEQHRLAGVAFPRELGAALGDHAPLSVPSGFEAAADGTLTLKGYVRLHDVPVDRRRSLALSMLAAAVGGTEVPPAVDWRRVELLGFGTEDGRLSTVKLYLHADPVAGFAEVGLPAVPEAHPFHALSGGRALAVIDLCGGRGRPPKWDFRLRDVLVTGSTVARVLASLLAPASARTLTQWVGAPGLHADLVAGALRGSASALYFELA